MDIKLTNRNIRLIKKIRRQDHYFSTRLPYANKKSKEICYSMVNTTHNPTQDTINKLQEMKGKTKLMFYKFISNYYDEMKIRTFRYEEEPFSKSAQGVSKNYHEVFLLMQFLQTKPQVKDMNFNYNDLYHTVN